MFEVPAVMRTLVWFRGKDLRVADHEPLSDAVAHGDVIPLFVLDPYFFDPERAQRIPHRMQFLLEALRELEGRIRELGSRLLVVPGRSTEVVPELAARWQVDRVVAQRWCEPFARDRDERVRAALRVPFQLFGGETLHDLGTLRSQKGTPFAVFSAFARAFRAAVQVGEPLAAPARLPPLPAGVSVESLPVPSLAALGLVQNPRVLRGGEHPANERLGAFLAGPGGEYDVLRDDLAASATSRISQDLKFGTLSARSVWARAERELGAEPRALFSFQNELLWREFSHATLWEFPHVLREPFRAQFRGFPWRNDAAALAAWQEGKTGYPLVDAAARQLLAEGFVHNRARMVAASFLTKHLLLDYRSGEAHYLRWLTDGDWAQNNAGWQWCAGTGTDAQPYFRIFNPVAQGAKFDPAGNYVRRWVPELARLPDRSIHAPWQAPAEALRRAGVTLGATYPEPIVEHTFARKRFLAVAESYLARARGRAEAP